MQNLPPQAELHELLDYDPLTGILLWRYRPQELGSWNSRYAGKPALASKNKKGYLYGSLSGSTVRAHRVIWKWYTVTSLTISTTKMVSVPIIAR